MTTKQAAYHYLNKGFSVIPIKHKSKKPLVSWLDYKFRLPTPDEIEFWCDSFGTFNLAIVCGSISNLVVIDVDFRNGGDNFLLNNYTWQSVKTNGGYHYYFRPNPLFETKSFRLKGIDVQAEGKYVVAPPSIHETGTQYEWINLTSANEIPTLPSSLQSEIISLYGETQNNHKEKDTKKFTKKQSEHEKFSILKTLDLLGIQYHQTGSNFMVSCPSPDHRDANPSCSVYTDSERFYCHACGFTEDAIGLVSKLKQLDFINSIKWLKENNV